MRGKIILSIVLCVVCGWFNMGLAGELSPLAKEAVSALTNRSKPDVGLLKQIASILPKLRKHLILEQTRGAREVSLYRETAPAVVLVVTDDGFGSGTIIDDDAHVLTNWHVVEGYSQVYVAFKPQNGEDLKKELVRLATVERIDKVSDLALLKIVRPIRPFSTIALGDSSTVEIGQDVFAIGHPSGEVWSFTKGIISQIRPNYQWPVSHQAKVIQTQTPINPGNSGGPLLDEHGRLIGVNSFIRPDSPGLNYAVAVETVQRFLQRPASDSPKSPSPSTPQQVESYCPDVYDTLNRGWTDIVGCYDQKGMAPPPDYWAIARDPEARQIYYVFGSQTKTQLDTIFHASRTKAGAVDWFFDTNCDGLVNVIGYQPAGSDKIERYRNPIESDSITSKASELHQALLNFRIPLSSVQFCQ